MSRAGLLAGGMIASLLAGCGCNSTSVGGSGEPDTVVPGAAPTSGVGTPGTPGPGPLTAPTTPPPTDRNPMPPQLAKMLDRLQTATEKAAIEKLALEASAQRTANPSDPLAWFAACMIESQLQLRIGAVGGNPQADAARTYLEQARHFDPEHRYEWLARYCDHYLARLAIDPKDPSVALKEAATALADCVQLAPGFVRGRVDLAQMLLINKQDEAAQRMLEEAAKRWADRWEVWYALAGVRLQQRQLLRALECMETAVKLRTDVLQLRYERLQLLLKVWKDLREQRHETPIRDEFAALRTLAEQTFTDEENRAAFVGRLGEQRIAFEFEVVRRKLADYERLPAAEQTCEAVFAHIDNTEARRMLVMEFASRVGDGTIGDPSQRVTFLLELLAKETETAVRIDAVRGLVYDVRRRGRGGSQEPWPPDVLAKVRPLGLAPLLTYAVDAGLPYELRTQILAALAVLGPDADAVEPLLVRLGVLVEEFLAARTAEAAGTTGGDGDTPTVDPIDRYTEIQALLAVVQAALGGRALPRLPHHRDDPDAEFTRWLERLRKLIKD